MEINESGEGAGGYGKEMSPAFIEAEASGNVVHIYIFVSKQAGGRGWRLWQGEVTSLHRGGGGWHCMSLGSLSAWAMLNGDCLF